MSEITVTESLCRVQPCPSTRRGLWVISLNLLVRRKSRRRASERKRQRWRVLETTLPVHWQISQKHLQFISKSKRVTKYVLHNELSQLLGSLRFFLNVTLFSWQLGLHFYILIIVMCPDALVLRVFFVFFCHYSFWKFCNYITVKHTIIQLFYLKQHKLKVHQILQ